MLEKYLAALDGAKHAVVFSSGMGAISAVIQQLKAGDHIICTDSVYGGTQLHLKWMVKIFNLSVTYHDFHDLETLPSKITPNTKRVMTIFYFLLE